jgi:glucose/mannose-6-phosphate isomerase
MEEAIKKFATQFNFDPEIQNSEKFKPAQSFVLAGMGGSHLSAGLLKMANPDLDLYIHRDYGLPALSHKKFASSLFIASSYSGNTEEVLDFVQKAHDKNYSVAVVALGGSLIDFAKKNNLPYIQLPDVGLEPRSALGFSLVALAKLTNNTKLLSDLRALSLHINPLKMEEAGKELAKKMAGKVPIIYSSRANISLAYNWKIKFNETGKIPAFYNIFPELNHNEMTSFDVIDSTKDLSKNFHFIFLKDNHDHPKVIKRMDTTKKLLEDRNFTVSVLEIGRSDSFWENVFNLLLLADWTALYISNAYGTEAEAVPMIEEFKKLIS